MLSSSSGVTLGDLKSRKVTEKHILSQPLQLPTCRLFTLWVDLLCDLYDTVFKPWVFFTHIVPTKYLYVDIGSVYMLWYLCTQTQFTKQSSRSCLALISSI